MKRSISKQIRVGGFIIAALVVMIIFVFTLGENSKLFESKASYQVLFSSTGGMYEGDPVLLTGVEVGNVTHIGFAEGLDEKRILVKLEVSRSIADRIRADSRAKIGSASIVYGKVVEISMGSPDQPVIPEDGFIQTDEKGAFSAMVDTTNQVLEDLRSVIAKIDRGDGLLSTVLNEPLEIRKTLSHLSTTTQKLSTILSRVEKGEGPLGEMVSDTSDFQQTLKDFRAATEDFKTITKSLSGKESVMGRMINDSKYGKEVTDDLKTTLNALANISVKIDTGYGTAGQLINDPSVYEGLQNVILGMENSSITRWMIDGRRKSGEKKREDLEKEVEDKN
ncbi:MCE family protein [candidate division KSB1 bacterium]|nr:MCE family protein [candidate division KSB1 bacterium]